MTYRRAVPPGRALLNALNEIARDNAETEARQNWMSVINADITDYNSIFTLPIQDTAGTPTFTTLQTLSLPAGRWVITAFVNVEVFLRDPGVGIPGWIDPTITSRVTVAGSPTVEKQEVMPSEGSLSTRFQRIQRSVIPLELQVPAVVNLDAWAGVDQSVGVGSVTITTDRASLIAFPG